jgi:hypothetical protein
MDFAAIGGVLLLIAITTFTAAITIRGATKMRDGSATTPIPVSVRYAADENKYVMETHKRWRFACGPSWSAMRTFAGLQVACARLVDGRIDDSSTAGPGDLFTADTATRIQQPSQYR